jgi:hypothetical protein
MRGWQGAGWMRIIVHAFWDDEAQVWAAQAEGGLGLFTEAETVEQLQSKLATLVPDLLENETGPFEIELVTRSLQV